jgi:two-component system cell cycle sensor histidine kinase/response regulator CckA
MKDSSKTKQKLIEELSLLKQRIRELEYSKSDRLQLEKALRESEEKYRNILESIQEGYFEMDLAGNLIFVNDSMCKRSGYTREEFIKMNYRQYLDETTSKKMNQIYSKIYKTGKPVRAVEEEYFRKDGTKGFCEISASLIRNSEGKPMGYRGFVRDVTERKRAESQREAALEALRVSEEKYRLVVENAKEAIIIAQDLKLVFVNRAAVDMIGYSGEILVSHLFTDFIHPDDRNMVVDYHIRRLKGESLPLAYSFRVISQDGTVKWVEFNTAVIQWKEKPATLSFLNDITERRQTEDKLRQSEEYFKEITENSSDVIIITDKNGDVKYCSRSIERFSGYKPEELIGKSGFTFIHPDDVERAADDFGKAILAVDSAIPNEFRLVLKDGSTRYFDGLGKNLLDNPAVAGFIMNVRDITERKQAESQREAALEKLRQSEERYRNILESIQEGYFELDLDGNYTFTNETNCRFLGYTKEELIGMNYRRHTDEETAKRLYQLYYELYRTGKPIELLDLESIRKDGTKAIYETSASLIRNSEGKPIGFRAVSRDVTERKSMEEALRQSEEKFRKAFYTSPDSMAISRLEDGMYISINPGFTRGTKYTEKDIIGKTSIEFNIWDNVEDRQRLVAKLKKDGEVINLEATFRRKSGEIRYGLVSASVIDLNGVPHLLSITRDITERKRVEEEKRKLEERLQSAHKMEAIGTLAGGIAHDFNNLLMGIQGYASLVLLNISQNDPNYEKLKRIEQQVQSGADLTRQLLGFARGGRYEVKPADINDLLQKTSSMFGRTKKEITIQMKCEKDLCPVEVDIGQMEQVFMNLYVNAWQAMPGGGYIYLETENIFLNDEQALLYSVKPGKYVKITVTDTGIGMDEKTRERIFDPFFTTKAMGRGTGLGLATVYGIIKGHKGMINVYSELGHGTTFTIYLPASQKEVVKKETATGTIERGTETILLVDDEKIVLEVSREMLESVGYRVYAVGSGQEAITLFTEKRNEIDLVILDMIMPGISGGETFDRLREINPGIKVLLSSGYSLNGEAQTIMDRGCKGFIQKPFQIEKLSQKVREMLD